MRIQPDSYTELAISNIMEVGTVAATTGDADDEAESPALSTIRLIREIDKYSGKLFFTLAYFVCLSVFLVIIVIWAFNGWKPISAYLYWPVYIFAAFLVAYFPVALWYGIRLILPLKRWLDSVSDVAFQLAFEFLPPKGDNPLDRILNKISEVYIEIPRLLAKRPGAMRKDVGVGKKKSVKWDLAIDLNYPRFHRLLRRFSTPRYILVKRIDAMKQVEVEEVRHIVKGTKNDLKWSTTNVEGMFIVSTCGFSNEAIDYAMEVSDEVSFDIELVFEYKNGFYLAEKTGPPELYPV